VRLPPPLKEHPRWLQALLAVVLPAAYGALTGYFLGVSEAKADLPDPPILLVSITTGLGAAFGALGGWLRERASRRQPAAAET
jgi:hypothetical protein